LRRSVAAPRRPNKISWVTYADLKNTLLKHQFGKTRATKQAHVAMQICAKRNAGMTSKSLTLVILRRRVFSARHKTDFTVKRVGELGGVTGEHVCSS
jgi:hypothetical protein